MTLVPLTVGFVPLLDCAPIVVAAEMGFAAAEGLELRLKRENAWATIRDRLVVGHFQAAHMLGPMPIAAQLGVGQVTVDLIAPMALGWGGNAITVASATWEAMLAQGAAAAAEPAQQGMALRAVVRDRARLGAAQLTLAMVHPFSCHHYELRYWLAACGIDPDDGVRLVVVPPPYMVEALRDGQIDGFCAGEPWNSLAVAAGIAHIVTPTTAIWNRSPEKVLGMRANWAERHPDETAALIRALYRASEWCEREQSSGELARLLARPEFIGEPATVIARGMTGALCLAPGSAAVPLEEFQGFARHFGTFPRVSDALWFYSQMVRWKQLPAAASAAQFTARALVARRGYRPDLYGHAVQSLGVDVPAVDLNSGGFFDHRSFDPADLDGYLHPP
jgi:NitT/TauT family transport system ATP-binding protein